MGEMITPRGGGKVEVKDGLGFVG